MEQDENIGPALAALIEEQRQQTMERFAVLRPHIDEGIPLSEAVRDSEDVVEAARSTLVIGAT